MKMTCSCKRCCIFSILAFSLLILIFGLVTWLVLPTLISKLVRKNLIISTKSSIYDMWVKPTVPIYFTFEFFIVTNRDDIFKGEKPILKKTGPYVYIKERIKKNVVFNSNETVSFNYQNFYYFQKNLSIGPETDMYVFVDFVTAASLSVHYYANETGKMDVFTIFDYPFNTQFFMNMSVNQYIFGYQHPAMMKLNKMYRMHETTEFGVLADDTLRNGSFSKTFEVWTGSDNVHPIGEFASWDYKNYLTYWNTKESNMINGTDGSSWSPGIKRDDILQLFSPELCRSVSLAYENDSSVLGISTFKFIGDPKLKYMPDKYPPSRGFCMKDCIIGIGDDVNTLKKCCLGEGVINMMGCKNSEIVMTGVNFLGAESFADGVKGLEKANKLNHGTWLEIEPVSGKVICARKMLQTNIMIRDTYIMEYVGNTNLSMLSNYLFPLFYVNESACIDHELANLMISQLHRPLKMANSTPLILLIAGIILLVIFLAVFAISQKRK